MYSPEELKFIASLPLEKIAISASCSASGDIGKVLHTDSKSASAVKKGIHPIVCKGYQQDANHIETSITLANLLDKVSTYCDSRFGSHFPIPSVITSKMYAQANHHPLLSLNEQVHSKLTQKDRGYILITAQAFAGKTEWAYSAVKNTLASYPSLTQPPQIDGYFFARRYASTEKQPDPNSTEVIYNASNTYVSEVNALQSLIATARKTRGVFASTNADGTSNAELFGKITYDMHADEDVLYDAFKNELEHLAKVAQPSADKPLILLLDGADELWGLSENSKNIRPIFPKLMPTEADLPAHTHIIITSRQGSHLTNMMQTVGGDIIELNIQTNDALQQDVEHYFQRLLVNPDATKTATGLQAFDYANELQPYQKLLQDKKLQQNIITASEGSFGYIPYLVKYLLQLDKPNRESTITAWRNHPQSLPAGIYGMRARELVGMYAQVKNKYPDIYEDFVYALASLSVVKAPLSANDVARLFFYDDFDRNTKTKREELIEALSNNSVCFSGSLADEPLVFQHKTLGELTYVFAMVETHLTTTIEQRSQTLAEQTKRRFNEGDDSIDADNVLYFIHHGISQSIFDTLIEALTDKHPKPIPVYQENHLKYLTLWGVYHFIKAHSKLPENKQRKAQASIQQILALLHNAGFLQTLIRTSPDEQSKNAIRATYIQADKLAHLHDSQRLHWKIESQILQHFDCLLEESMMMGGILWNMLGAWQQGQAFSEDWKGSIDKEAIITQQAGTPPDFDRMIEGYEHQAMTECGQWLVTTGENGTAIWDLRDGLHRAVKLVEDTELHLNELSIAVKECTIYFSSYQSSFVVLAKLSLSTKSLIVLYFSGHTSYVRNTQLIVASGNIWITSSSNDMHIGLVFLMHQEEIQAYQVTDNRYEVTNKLLRFSGHTNRVTYTQLQIEADSVYIISQTDYDEDTGILYLTINEIQEHILELQINKHYIVSNKLLKLSKPNLDFGNANIEVNSNCIYITFCSYNHICLFYISFEELQEHFLKLQTDKNYVINNKFLLFSGHTECVNQIHLKVEESNIFVATCSEDKHIGLLFITVKELQNYFLKLQDYNSCVVDKKLIRFSGHADDVTQIQLKTESGNIIITSGSRDKQIGLLSMTYEEVRAHQVKLQTDSKYLLENKLLLFKGHTSWIESVKLQVQTSCIFIVSGCDDKYIGLLSITHQDIQAYQAQLRTENKNLVDQLLRFSGHMSDIRQTCLQVDKDHIFIASNDENHVGLLSLTPQEIQIYKARLLTNPNNLVDKKILRFSGHSLNINNIDLKVQKDIVYITSGSNDKYIGLLCLTINDIHEHGLLLLADRSYIVHNNLLRFHGHRNWVTSTHLQVHAHRIFIASNAFHGCIGLLSLTYEDIQGYQAKLQADSGYIIENPLRFCERQANTIKLAVDGYSVFIVGANGSSFFLWSLSYKNIHDYQSKSQTKNQSVTDNKILHFRLNTRHILATQLEVTTDLVNIKSVCMDRQISLFSLTHKEIQELSTEETYGNIIEPNQPNNNFNGLNFFDEEQGMTVRKNVIYIFDTTNKTFIYSPFNQPNFHPHHIAELNEREIIVVGDADKDIAIMMFERINPNQDEQTDSEPRTVN